MSTRAEFFQSMYPGLSNGEVIDELIKASIYGFEHGPEVVTISAAEGIHYVPYDAEMQKKLPYYGGTYEACNIPFTDFQIRYQPEQIRIVDSKRILEDAGTGSGTEKRRTIFCGRKGNHRKNTDPINEYRRGAFPVGRHPRRHFLVYVAAVLFYEPIFTQPLSFGLCAAGAVEKFATDGTVSVVYFRDTISISKINVAFLTGQQINRIHVQ